MSQRTVGIVMNRLLGDEVPRFRFAVEPIETLGDLHAHGLELTPSEIVLFLESDLEMWCATDQISGGPTRRKRRRVSAQSAQRPRPPE